MEKEKDSPKVTTDRHFLKAHIGMDSEWVQLGVQAEAVLTTDIQETGLETGRTACYLIISSYICTSFTFSPSNLLINHF